MANWYCAVTTAPRKDCTLIECIQSLRNCGWEPAIFAEPGSTPTDGIERHDNPARLGVWHNWLASAKHAVNVDCDFILTVQDDCIFHPDSKDFVESIDWPENAAFVSLYTPKHYTIRKDGSLRPAGVNRIVTRSLWGACALVWKPGVLRQFVEHRVANNWAGARPRSGNPAVIANRLANPHVIANSDTAIGKIANALERPMFFVDPSPTSHIAVHSTIGHGDNTGRRNAHRIADHSLPLAYQVLGK